MVASTHWLASAAGMAVLEKGGNAFDAAVAAGLTLQVVEPHLNGPGGEVPIILYDARRESVDVICGQGPSPARLSIELFEELGLEVVPGTGSLAACVPGAFGAWMLMLRDYGTLRLADVMGYALRYAERGYPLLAQISDAIGSVEQQFRTQWTTSAELYLTPEGPPPPGSLWRNPALARTYHRLLSEAESASEERDEQIEAARRIFYEGFVAEAIVDFMEVEVMDSSGRPHTGVMDERDLGDYRATVEQPLWLDYHDLRVFKTQSWGQGPVFLQQLALLAGYDQLLRPPYFAAFGGRTINIHPSLLPAHGGAGMTGAAVHRSVLDSGDLASGVTIHEVTPDLDGGPILAQARVPVLPGDDAEILAARVLLEEHRLLVSTLEDLAAGFARRRVRAGA